MNTKADTSESEEDEEKKFLEELKEGLRAISNQAGEVIKRVNELQEKITDYERRHERWF